MRLWQHVVRSCVTVFCVLELAAASSENILKRVSFQPATPCTCVVSRSGFGILGATHPLGCGGAMVDHAILCTSKSNRVKIASPEPPSLLKPPSLLSMYRM
jgi:hypothetical protein